MEMAAHKTIVMH